MQKKNILFSSSCMLLFMVATAQNDHMSQSDVLRNYEYAERMYLSQNYVGALQELKRNNLFTNGNDSLLYLKVKVLESLHLTQPGYGMELDSTLKRFLSKVNRFSFSELKYEEVVQINTQFQHFREQDKKFYDSTILMKPEKEEELTALSEQVGNYLKSAPNTFYHSELLALKEGWDKRKNAIVTYNLNQKILKRTGKSGVLAIGYSKGQGNLSAPFSGLNGYNEVINFFSGTYTKGLGVKYSLNASIASILFNIYSSSRFKAGINWTILEGEYTVFDWSRDTLMGIKESEHNTVGDSKSIKAGTNLSISFTGLLTHKIALSLYYSARPGALFLTDKYYFSTGTGSTEKKYSIEPQTANYNLSHEFGIKFFFFERLYINPFFHFGNFNWKSKLKSDAGDTDLDLKANYQFKFVGIRIGV